MRTRSETITQERRKTVMPEEDVNQANEQPDRDEPVESLNVKTNVKAGGDPDVPGIAPQEDPIIVGGG
jgi:hypothetical protein